MKQYRWGASAEAVEMDGEWVVMSAQDYTITKLNDVGGFIWSKMSEPQTSDQLVRHVLQEYHVQEPLAAADVEQFLDNLTSIGLLECVTP